MTEHYKIRKQSAKHQFIRYRQKCRQLRYDAKQALKCNDTTAARILLKRLQNYVKYSGRQAYSFILNF